MAGAYPAGVTIMHPAFGPDTVDTEQRECDSETAWVPKHIVQSRIDGIHQSLISALASSDPDDRARFIDRATVSVLGLVEDMREHEADFPCEFDGPADVAVTGSRRTATATWSCPRCGTEHEDDVTPEPDDDDWRDR